MSYRSDQWFNLHNTEATGESLSTDFLSNRAGAFVTGATNLPFRYPDRSIRDIDGNSRSPMKRGYIRSLAFGENKEEFTIQKCQFQFNPSQIAQSVQQNTAVLNFIQQDPAQYAQPMPGNVSFSFDLFFDRSAELNDNNLPLNSLDTSNPWETGNPAEVGVLHDLAQLYKVIGVGVNSAMADYLTKTAIAARNAETADAANDPDADTLPEFDSAGFNSDVNTFMGYNVGNTAFLLPLPCRIVFSSLYIVEGLVKDINVLFTKFTETMVPMQCSVQVMFEAKYIGFAKRDTFFEYALRELEQTELVEPTIEESNAYAEAIADDLSTVKMVFINNSTARGSANASNALSGPDYGRNFDWTSSTFSVDGAIHSRGLYGVLSEERSGNADIRLRDYKGAIKLLFPKEAENRRLRSLIQNNGVSLSISASGQLDVYRYTRDIPGDNKVGFTELRPGILSPISRAFGPPLSIASADTVYPSSDNLRVAYTQLKNAIENQRFVSAGAVGASVLLPADPGGEEHAFKNAAHIISIKLNSSNLGDNGVVTASSVEDLDKMMEWACVSSFQDLGTPDNDISTDSEVGDEDGLERYYPQHDQGYFGYLARFQVTISVTINQRTTTRTAVDYRLFAQNTDFTGILNPGWLQKSINLDWPAPTPTTPTGGSGSSTDSDNNDYPWDITGG